MWEGVEGETVPGRGEIDIYPFICIVLLELERLDRVGYQNQTALNSASIIPFGFHAPDVSRGAEREILMVNPKFGVQ